MSVLGKINWCRVVFVATQRTLDFTVRMTSGVWPSLPSFGTPHEIRDLFVFLSCPNYLLINCNCQYETLKKLYFMANEMLNDKKIHYQKIRIHEDWHFALNIYIYIFFCVFKIENRFFALNSYVETYGP